MVSDSHGCWLSLLVLVWALLLLPGLCQTGKAEGVLCVEDQTALHTPTLCACALFFSAHYASVDGDPESSSTTLLLLAAGLRKKSTA